MKPMWKMGIATALVLVGIAALPSANAATRTFDFEPSTGNYGNPDDLCQNGPVPPLFNRPEYAGQTANYIVNPAGCGQGGYGVSFGSDSYLTAQVGGRTNLLRFSWEDPTNNSTWARVITGPYSYYTPLHPNPTVHLGVGSKISMKLVIYAFDETEVESPSGALEFALSIRETGQNLPLGEDGGDVGSVEFLGIDSKGVGTDANTPVGGALINHSPYFASNTIEWTLVDDEGVVKVDVSVNGGEPVRKSVVGLSGDGVICQAGSPCEANLRGVLDGLVIRKPEADTVSKKWFVWVDDIAIDAPGVTDPVQIIRPLVEFDTQVTIKNIDPEATEVRLYQGAAGSEVMIASATNPPETFPDGRHTFTLPPLAKNDRLTATQVVAEEESEFSGAVIVSEFGMIEDFNSGFLGVAGGDQYRQWYDVSGITWAFTRVETLAGSPAMGISDGGWTNGKYAIYPGVFPADGGYHVRVKMHVIEPAGSTILNAFTRYQLGVSPVDPPVAPATVSPAHRGSGALQPCPFAATYTGLTTGNDTAIGPKTLRTAEFQAIAGQDIVLAFSTDVTSGGWNGGGSVTWNSWDNVYIVVDDIALIQGPPPISNCSEVSPVGPAGPLVEGATVVNVSSVGPSAVEVKVYVNDVLRGTLDTSTTGGGTKAVPITGALVRGDVVRATQTYLGADGTTLFEGCASSQTGVVGVGPNPGTVLLTIGLRETNSTSGIGADGGNTGPIEWLGATGDRSGAPLGKPITPNGEWQTVTFYPVDPDGAGPLTADPIRNYESGNGVLNYSGFGTPKGVLEHLAITPLYPDSGPYILYIDNVKSGSTLIGAGFETFTAGTQNVMFRNPRYLGVFGNNLLPEPAISVIDDTVADASGKSLRVEFQFSNVAAGRFARLTTYSLYGIPSPDVPNPTVAFNQPISLRVKLVKPPITCHNPFADADGDADVDMDDFGVFQRCFLGAGKGMMPGCWCFDRDLDGDVDTTDFGPGPNTFMGCASRAGVPANAACDD